ncbi:MAG: hypothetical protein QGH93_00060, partial [Gammaproteobacteria bacterium]|nr:hypothetical protein [Gammaproteobacteria bacterium]
TGRLITPSAKTIGISRFLLNSDIMLSFLSVQRLFRAWLLIYATDAEPHLNRPNPFKQVTFATS